MRIDTPTALLQCSIVGMATALSMHFDNPLFLFLLMGLLFTRQKQRKHRPDATTIERAFDYLHYDLDAVENMIKTTPAHKMHEQFINRKPN